METTAVLKSLDGEVLMEEVSQTAPHSVELSCNAKGQYSWTVKLYFREDQKSSIGDELELIVNQLRARYSNPPSEVEAIKKLALQEKKI